ncbi:MAG: hypothetical protein GWO08_20095, partial [Gammaproteobacteria bacterium]|nr:hypothetical protein [Gammaproteobacteria bacterium]
MTDGSWSSATVSTGSTNYSVNLSGAPNDHYQYRITYTRPGESQVYAAGAGEFSITSSDSVGSTHAVAIVEDGFYNFKGITKRAVYESRWITDGYTQLETGWWDSNRVSVAWDDLSDIDTSKVRVVLNYVEANGAGQRRNNTRYWTGSSNSTSTTFAWGPPDNNYYGYYRLHSVRSIHIQKHIDGAWVTVRNGVTGDAQQSRSLLIRGNVTGLSDIVVTGEDGREYRGLPLTPVSTNLYRLNIGSLERGHYTWVPEGTTSVVGGEFTVGMSAPVNTDVVVQESVGHFNVNLAGQAVWEGRKLFSGYNYITYDWYDSNRINFSWDSLEEWGTSNIRVRLNYVAENGSGQTRNESRVQQFNAFDAERGASMVWSAPDGNSGGYYRVKSIRSATVEKYVNGAWVTVYSRQGATSGDASRLMFTGIPAGSSVEFEYRPASAEALDPYQSKTASSIGTGWYAVAYDDIPVGEYAYRVIVNGDVNNAVEGMLEIKRDQDEIPFLLSG